MISSTFKYTESIKTLLILFLPHTHRLLAVLNTSPSSVKKNHPYYLGGIRTHDLCNSRAVSYQLDYRDCPVARGSSKNYLKIKGRVDKGFNKHSEHIIILTWVIPHSFIYSWLLINIACA